MQAMRPTIFLISLVCYKVLKDSGYLGCNAAIGILYALIEIVWCMLYLYGATFWLIVFVFVYRLRGIFDDTGKRFFFGAKQTNCSFYMSTLF